MSLPIAKTYAPMEAQPATDLPVGPQWQYEPKWDGFRCLAFRDGKRVDLQSKSGKPLTRYFPELVSALGALQARKFVLDGEIVIPVDGDLSFDQLLMRIHPSASRVEKLSRETPCMFIVFDLLVSSDGKSLAELPLEKRRQELDRLATQYLKKDQTVRLSPYTVELPVAQKWFHMGTSVDGVVAKRRDLSYQSGTRNGMEKIKKVRTADCVVGGFRYLEKEPLVGSLLLGLYNKSGELDHVGFTSSISAEARPALTRKLKKLVKPPGFTGKAPGGPSRWSNKRSMEWQPLAPKLVVEVQFDHFTGGRFRHGTKFMRWRPDKNPSQCTMKQVERENRSALNLL
ncbi:MAG TPA: ATP-dependent DNA ligase [Candidatus Sulfotelmatobacter sp.]|jgi:ATP-dependent DNA ligase|nr:ATP-dependent DNA ligase [Candidatus Sulfotelmatobacter sp.]